MGYSFKTIIRLLCLLGLLWSWSCSSWRAEPQQHIAPNSEAEIPLGAKPEAMVLFYSSIGAGHISAASTIKDELLKKRPELTIIMKDVRDFGLKMLGSKKLHEKVDRSRYMFIFTNFPELYNSYYNDHITENLKASMFAHEPLSIQEDEVFEFLQEVARTHHLTHALSTHYMGARALGLIKMRRDLRASSLQDMQVSWINTDYFVGYFPRISQYLDKTFLAHSVLRQVWINRGVDAATVEAVGLPMRQLDLRPTNTTEKANIMAALGFPTGDNETLITIATGGTGIGDYPRIVKSIFERFKQTPLGVNIIAVPTTNASNRKALERIRQSMDQPERLKVFNGLLPQDVLLSYINASDLYITKAGGLSPTEGMMLNRPLVLLNIFGGHERENAAFFKGLGVAEVIDSYEDAGPAAYQLLTNTSQRETMLQAQREFIKGFDTSKIISFLLASHPQEQSSAHHLVEEVRQQGNSALAQLEKLNPAEVEIFLSYTIVPKKGAVTNPFGHLALRINNEVFTTLAEAKEQGSQQLLVNLPVSEYLWGLKPAEDSIDNTGNTYGQLWARSLLSMRISGLTRQEVAGLRSALMEIEKDYQAGKVDYKTFTSNCAHHVNRIFSAAGLKLASRTTTPMVQLPLHVFQQAATELSKHERFSVKFVYYEQAYEERTSLIADSSFNQSKYPLSMNILDILTWAATAKVPSKISDFDRSTNYRLSYYPHHRVVFENLDTYRENELLPPVVAAELPTSSRRVVIPTFDDGPVDRYLWSKKAKKCPSEAEFLASLHKILGTLREKNMRAVFYVNGWGNIERDASCPSRTEAGLKETFQHGVQAIAAENHVVALHAFDHQLYRRSDISSELIKDDLSRLQAEIAAAGVSAAPLWRTPYGSHSNLHQAISQELSLTPRAWDIDSFDYLAHDDSPIRTLFNNQAMQRIGSQVGIAYTTKNLRVSASKNFVDILFHVNPYTGENLSGLLKNSEIYLKKNQPEFAKKEGILWSQHDQPHLLDSYIYANGVIPMPPPLPEVSENNN